MWLLFNYIKEVKNPLHNATICFTYCDYLGKNENPNFNLVAISGG